MVISLLLLQLSIFDYNVDTMTRESTREREREERDLVEVKPQVASSFSKSVLSRRETRQKLRINSFVVMAIKNRHSLEKVVCDWSKINYHNLKATAEARCKFLSDLA